MVAVVVVVGEDAIDVNMSVVNDVEGNNEVITVVFDVDDRVEVGV